MKMSQWSNGFCGCFSVPKLCVIVYFAPCYVVGKNADSLGQDGVWFSSVYGCPILNFLCAAKLRTKLREVKGIDGSPVMDILLHVFLPCCALFQETAELDNVTWSEATRIDRV